MPILEPVLAIFSSNVSRMRFVNLSDLFIDAEDLSCLHASQNILIRGVRHVISINTFDEQSVSCCVDQTSHCDMSLRVRLMFALIWVSFSDCCSKCAIHLRRMLSYRFFESNLETKNAPRIVIVFKLIFIFVGSVAIARLIC